MFAQFLANLSYTIYDWIIAVFAWTISWLIELVLCLVLVFVLWNPLKGVLNEHYRKPSMPVACNSIDIQNIFWKERRHFDKTSPFYPNPVDTHPTCLGKGSGCIPYVGHFYYAREQFSSPKGPKDTNLS